MLPDGDVVGNLHEIVDPGTLTDYRVSRGSPIDCGVRTDPDVILDEHSSKLRHRNEASGRNGKPKTFLANPAAGTDLHARSDNGVTEGCPSLDMAIRPDDDVALNDNVRSNLCSSADGGSRLDDNIGTDARRRIHERQIVNCCSWVNSS